MTGLQFTYHFTGPADQGILLKNRGNNAIVNAPMGMPQKFSPSAGDSMFSNARRAYVKDSGGGALLSGHYDSSQHIYLKKLNAIGKGSTLKSTVSFQGKSNDSTFINSSLARVRGGGTVAPKKKGAIANTFKSGGGSSLTGSGNRQYNLTGTINHQYNSIEVVTTFAYTLQEISTHSNTNDAWITFEGNVYNITPIMSDVNNVVHNNMPSKEEIGVTLLQSMGKDITNIMRENHSPGQLAGISSMLSQYKIGVAI